MKKVILAIALILVALGITAVGCTNTDLVGPLPGDGSAVISSCVACHTDKARLKEVAAPEPVEVVSEATTGEG